MSHQQLTIQLFNQLCRFFNFTIILQGKDLLVQIRITGSKGARQFLGDSGGGRYEKNGRKTSMGYGRRNIIIGLFSFKRLSLYGGVTVTDPKKPVFSYLERVTGRQDANLAGQE